MAPAKETFFFFFPIFFCVLPLSSLVDETFEVSPETKKSRRQFKTKKKRARKRPRIRGRGDKEWRRLCENKSYCNISTEKVGRKTALGFYSLALPLSQNRNGSFQMRTFNSIGLSFFAYIRFDYTTKFL